MTNENATNEVKTTETNPETTAVTKEAPAETTPETTEDTIKKYFGVDALQLYRANKMITPMSMERRSKDKNGNWVSKTSYYAEVNQRIEWYRMMHPFHSVITKIISHELIDYPMVNPKSGEVKFVKTHKIIMECTVSDEVGRVLANAHSFEIEANSNINRTSYIENCETSVVGRALGMMGVGVNASLASFEEVAHAIEVQNATPSATTPKPVTTATPKQVELIKKLYDEDEIAKMLQSLKVEKLEDITVQQASKMISHKKRED